VLNNEFLPAVTNYPNIDEMWFPNDGASAHYSIKAQMVGWWFGGRGQVDTLPDHQIRTFSSGAF
jgi:hypothetical protein